MIDVQAENAKQAPSPHYAYQGDTKLVAIQQHGQWLIGTLDGDGEFVRDRRIPALHSGLRMWLLSLLVPTINKATNPGEPVYEMRGENGYLIIKGTLNAHGKFVPEVGSKVEGFGSYLEAYCPNKSLRVYNLAGLLYDCADAAAEKVAEKRMEGLSILSAYPPVRVGNGELSRKAPFVFQALNYRRVDMMRDGIRFRGMLDPAGSFVRDAKYVPEGGELPDGEMEFPGAGGLGGQIILGEPRFAPRINSDWDDEGLYELRQDVLIPGKLDRNGRFIPEVDRKIVRFERVVKAPDLLRIYNLPGWFVPIRW